MDFFFFFWLKAHYIFFYVLQFFCWTISVISQHTGDGNASASLGCMEKKGKNLINVVRGSAPRRYKNCEGVLLRCALKDSPPLCSGELISDF